MNHKTLDNEESWVPEPSWRSTVEPYASRWAAVIEEIRLRGSVHGETLGDFILDPGPGTNWTLTDTSRFLTDMVRAGAIAPYRRNVRGLSHSAKTFRSLQRLRSFVDKPIACHSIRWWVSTQAGDAYVWQFALPEEGVK